MHRVQIPCRQRNLSNVIKAINADWPLNVVVKLSLQQNTVGGPEAIIYQSAKCIDAIDICASQCRLEVKRNLLIRTDVRSSQQFPKNELAHAALRTNDRFTEKILPPQRFQLRQIVAKIKRGTSRLAEPVETIGACS